MSVRDLILWKYIKRYSNERPDHTSFISNGKRVSYKELDELSDRLAKAFLSMNVEKGDVIATLLPPSLEYVYIYVAAAKIGAILLPLDLREKAPDLIRKVNDLHAKIFITLNTFAGHEIGSQILMAKDFLPSVKFYILSRGLPENPPKNFLRMEGLLENRYEDYNERLEKMIKAVEPEDAFLIIYTGGTTGKPKGAILTQKSCISMSLEMLDIWKVEPTDIMPFHLPPSHVGGSTDLLCTILVSGATGSILEYYHPNDVLKMIMKNKLTVYGGVPTMYQMELSLPNFKSYDFSSLRLAIVSGAPTPPDLMDKILHYGPNATGVNGYGLTETSGFITFTAVDDPVDKKLNSVGKPGKNVQIKIVDEEGKEVLVNEVGEILVKGPMLMKGYILEEENKKVFTKDGFVHTGDLAYRDEDGYIFLVGRKKEMYKTAGYSVYPARIENLLIKYSGVLMATVIGVPDKIYGEVGVAFIVPKPGAKLSEEDLKKYCEAELAEYEMPKKFIIRDNLPLTSLGKVDKPALKKELGLM